MRMSWTDWLLILISICWLGEMIIFRNRQESSDGQSEHKSFYTVSFIILSVFLASLVFSGLSHTIPSTFQRIIGLIFYSLGVSLRFWGITHLRNQFTRHVVVQPTDELASSGPYRFLRHPLYTGLLSITFGFSLYFLTWWLAIFGAILTSIALLQRIHIEEQMLVTHFGQKYINWSKSRKRLFPFIY